MDLRGKVVVITGASSGIGRRTAVDLASAGAVICAAARRTDRLESLIEEIGGEPRGHSFHVTDVSVRADVRNLESHVRSTYGRCDILINNAGFSAGDAFTGPAAIDETERIMATNFFGAVYCTAELLPLLEASAPSHVVNVASVAGRIAVGVPAYTASKFALVGWSEALTLELPKKGIYVSSVEPGFIPTEGFQHEGFKRDPIKRHMLGTEADVSKAIQDAIAGRKVQRVVPRWYYLLQVPQLLVPRAARAVARRMYGSRF